MHRLPFATLILGIQLLSPISPSLAADEEPLPKKVEFELSLWQARLGLKKIHMRELRFAARTATETVKKAKQARADDDPWATFKPEGEPWASIKLPRPLKEKSFTDVAEAILTEQQLTDLKAFKLHAKKLRADSMRISRAHERLAILTSEFYLTETQRAKILELISARATTRRQRAAEFKGREDQMPEAKPLRQTSAFRELLDANQLKLLQKQAEAEEQ